MVLLGLALAVLGIAVALRSQKGLAEKLFVTRLEASDLPPDEAIKSARALEDAQIRAAKAARADGRTSGVLATPGADLPAFKALERLSPPAKLRYLLATGVMLADLTPQLPPPPSADLAAYPDRINAGIAAEARLQGLLADLSKAHPDVATRFLAEASDPLIRRRAAQALALGGDLRALPALKARFADPDVTVRLAALQAGSLIARRSGDMTARIAFLSEAARVPGIARKATDQDDLVTDPRIVPVLLAYMERPEAGDTDRAEAIAAIHRIMGPEQSSGAPRTSDAAAWRAWWETQDVAPSSGRRD